MTRYATSSLKAQKRRKVIYNAPSHVRGKIMSATLSKELREQNGGVRSLPIHTGDEVEITRGQFKGRKGTVKAVYRLRYQVLVDRIERETARGKTVNIPFKASTLRITKLQMNAHRETVLQRKQQGRAAAAEQKNKA
uniref:KOW domain-containing protein n=1 Tax=Percolomonas cosmopolitus TaxID=63605 RepID=A0A7S1KTR3_9EUKA|eukprot:CAMPEP_0117450410 /NCGR_PEP_ID=MMETSP0759-20121206/8454_1 /TAXON_ID=63605 /ORGANISM="Percolomonas cosmopolitus, Strain WS" /LENGTH=136 /DNA_ID=CAMNT_0005242931 /DNA_START=51 /DNA_END=461 /DNA_ORIENTATION=+